MGARISTLLAVAAVAALIAGFFAVLSQPFVEPLASAPAAVDPARLEAHVKRLSVDFHPRRFDEARNTALAAQYIHDTLAATVGLRDRLGIIVGAVAGVIAGAVAESFVDRREQPAATETATEAER